MRYKEGDKVRLKDGLVVGNYYDDCWFIEAMKVLYKGKELEIDRANYYELDNRYKIKGCRWAFSGEMFESVPSKRHMISVTVTDQGKLVQQTSYHTSDDFECLFWDQCGEIGVNYNLDKYSVGINHYIDGQLVKNITLRATNN